MSEKESFLSFEQLFEVLTFTVTATAVHIGESATIQFANKAMLAIWGKDQTIIGKTLSEALPELDNQPFGGMLAKVFREGVTISGKDTAANLIVNGKLSTFYFDFEYRAIKDKSGKVICVLHTAQDVTDRFLYEKELQQAADDRLALQREQSLNEELAAANEELNAINEELSRSREELSLLNQELENRVEDRVRAFAESEERFRTMAEGTDILIAVGDESGKPFYFNKAWCELTGRAMDVLLKIGWTDLLHEEDKEEYIAIHQSALAKRSSYTDEFRVLGVDKTYHWLLKKGTPRFLSNGTFAGYISSCIDITTRKQAEEQLQEVNEELASSNEELLALNEELATINEELEKSNIEIALSEQRFKNLVLQAPVGICVIRAADLVITDVNEVYIKLVGKSRKELEHKQVWDAIAEAADAYAPIMESVITTGNAFFGKEVEIELYRNGIPEVIFVDFVYEPVKNLAGRVYSIMVVATEVTDKVIARKKLEEIEERIRLAVEATEMGTFDLDYKSGVLLTSERFNEIYNVSDKPNRNSVLNRYHDADKHLSGEAHKNAEVTGKLFYEARIINDDDSIAWVRIQGNVYFDDKGEKARLLGTVLDITDYKLLQQQKDDFISIASHELKTPITSLKASLQILERMKANPTPMLPKLIEQSTRSMQKISELVEDLLNVSRMNQGQIHLSKREFVLAEMMENCCAHVRQYKRFEFILQGDKTLTVIADEHRIEQVVVNFVNNVVKYAANSKVIYITIEKSNDLAKVSVQDNGPGIEPSKIPHLFERYYRADNTGAQVSGLGLGLYISAEIIKRHGGNIGVNSELGKGSTFWFTLPL